MQKLYFRYVAGNEDYDAYAPIMRNYEFNIIRLN